MSTVDDVCVDGKSEDTMEMPEKTASIYLEDPVNLKSDNEPKRINVILSPDTANRLKKIQEKLTPSTQTEAVSKALHILETLIAAHENGTKIYVQNKGSDEMAEFRLFRTAA